MTINVALETTLDTEADSLYIYLRDKNEKPVSTCALAPSLIADLDKHGNIVGLELISFTKLRQKKEKS